jgi:hypothetical protein
MTTPDEILVFVNEQIAKINKIRSEMLGKGNKASKEFSEGVLSAYNVMRIKLEGKVEFVDEPEHQKNFGKSKSSSGTTFDNKALILGQLWVNNKEEDEWNEFFEYNDLGLPLAFAYDMRNLLAHGYYKVDVNVVYQLRSHLHDLGVR